MKVLLLVTWIANSGLSSYHVDFDDMKACEAARTALLQDRVRMVAGTMVPQGFQVLQVSAVCITH